MLIAIRSRSSSLTAAVTAKRHQSCHEGRAHVTGLASHWPCITGGLSSYELNGLCNGDEHPAYIPLDAFLYLYLYLYVKRYLFTTPMSNFAAIPLSAEDFQFLQNAACLKIQFSEFFFPHDV